MGDSTRFGVRHAWHRLPRRAIVLGLVALFLSGVLIGGYLVGSSSGTDLDDVENAASEAGRKAGFEKGSEEGYARGLEEARKRSYHAAYAAAYRKAYANEFELAGLDPPEQIPVPERQ